MKTGDKFGVYIAGQQVAQASVVEIDKDTATLIVPATRVVMAVRTQLAPEVEDNIAPLGNDHVLLGAEDQAPGVVAEAVDIAPAAPVNGEGEVTPVETAVPANQSTEPVEGVQEPTE